LRLMSNRIQHVGERTFRWDVCSCYSNETVRFVQQAKQTNYQNRV
jgi:hypothetical protein